MIESVELIGGASCAVDPTAATEVAAVGVWYAYGSRDEDAAEAGSTHFIEHMLFKGTRKRGAYDIAREIDRLGGSVNAFTEREAVAFYAVVPADGFEKTAEILVDMINESQFDPAEFERERSVIENELSAAEDDPEEVAADAFAALLWPSHPLGRKIGGEIEDVRNLERDAVHRLYRDRFAGSVDFVSVAGDVEASRAQSAFQGAFTKKPERSRTAPLAPFPSGAHYHAAPFQHVQVFCSFQLPGKRSLNDYFALQTANTAMGESMSSRLFQSLRERKGLCYSVYSSPTLLSDNSMWTVFASSTVDTLSALIDGISDELSRVLDEKGLSGTELRDAQAQLAGGLKLSTMDLEHRMRRLARQRLYGEEALSVPEEARLIAGIESDTANGALLDYLKGSEPLLFAAGPAKARKQFMQAAERLLSRFGGVDANRESAR